MPNTIPSSNTVQVLADLTLRNSNGEIYIKNNKEGDLLVDFPNEDAFFSLLKIHWPFQSGWKLLFQLSRAFYRNRQAVSMRVNEHPWMTLGRSPRPQINYLKVAPTYVSRSPAVKNGVFAIAAALGAALLYIFFKRRN